MVYNYHEGSVTKNDTLFSTYIHNLIQLTAFIIDLIYFSWLRPKLIWLIEVTQLTDLFNLIEFIGLIELIRFI